MQPGSIIADKFRVERVLGQGGMGVVVVATHLQLHQTVALKFVHADIVSHPEIVERMLREARASAQLKSEHVCRVMDVGQLASGAPYIVMELLDGMDLAAVVRAAPLSPMVASSYVLQACVAIAEAHAAGIVHRDLKPSNLFLTERMDGSPLVKVLDFGIAKAPSTADAGITKTSTVMGSPGYMSPEQLRSSKVVDARADIWSLGVILYEAVAGHLPFRAETMMELAVKVSMDPPEPLVADPAYVAIVMRCLEKPLDRRYQSIADLAVDLARIAGPRGDSSAAAIARLSRRSGPGPVAAVPLPATEPPLATSVSPSTMRTGSAKRWPWLVGGCGAVLVAAIAIGVASSGGKPADPTTTTTTTQSTQRPSPPPDAAASPDPTEPEALAFLDEVYARQHGGVAGTREEALAWLDTIYAQQLASEAQRPDPDAVFSVDVSAAVGAEQQVGSSAAGVTVVEAFDFACPYCETADGVMTDLVAEYGGRVRIVYMNVVVHPFARTAHLYGCAAARQGKFAGYRAAVYEQAFKPFLAAGGKDTSFYDANKLSEIGDSLGLDVSRLASDARSRACASRIDADQTELAKFHVNATPSFFINGRVAEGARPKQDYKAMIDAALKRVDASGVPSASYYDAEIRGKGLAEFKAAPGHPPTRADAIAMLVKQYAVEKAKTSHELDPDGVFAVDIARAVQAHQIRGPETALVTIVEAFDFACLPCRETSSVVDAMIDNYKGKVRVIPMSYVVHPQIASEAHLFACAAAKRVRFGAMMDAIWAKAFDPYVAGKAKDPSAFSTSSLGRIAGSLGFDVAALVDDAHGDACKSRIADDMAELAKFKVTSTPTLFINGKPIVGEMPKQQLAAIVEQQLAIAEKSGVPAADYYEREVLAKGSKQFRARAP